MTEDDTFNILKRKINIAELVHRWSHSDDDFNSKEADMFFESYGWTKADYEYEAMKFIGPENFSD